MTAVNGHASVAGAAIARNVVLADRANRVDLLTAEVLRAQAALPREQRDQRVVDLALDVREALCLLPVGGKPVPVVPGRAS